jgi:TRAP-type transport system small permease protein
MTLGRMARLTERAIERVCRVAAIGLGIVVFLLMLAGIAGRHVFSDGLPAVTELPEQLFPWWVMVSIVLAARAGAHVAVEALASVVPPRVQAGLVAAAHGLTILMSGAVAWTTWQVSLITGGDRSPILGIPLLHFYVAMALGFVLLGVLSACALARPRETPA